MTSSGNDDETRGKRISLVLGAGGARGLAHIGIIRELESRGYRIDSIAGCSMGALVGGLYALGKLEDYTDWVSDLTGTELLRLLDLTRNPGGLIAGQKVMKRLHRWIGDTDIEDLPIKFTAVAVDIERQRQVWMSDGSLFDAIRASIAIPGVFTPHRYRGRLLVDGGILNPIPVAPTVNSLVDQIFVVDANGPPTDDDGQNDGDSDSGDDKKDDDDRGWLASLFATLGWGEAIDADSESRLDMLDILLRSLDTMQAALTRQHLAVFQPDGVFRVPRNLYMTSDFHRAPEIIELGRRIARETLDAPGFGQRQWL